MRYQSMQWFERYCNTSSRKIPDPQAMSAILRFRISFGVLSLHNGSSVFLTIYFTISIGVVTTALSLNSFFFVSVKLSPSAISRSVKNDS